MYKGRETIFSENNDNKKSINDLKKEKECLLQLQDMLTEESINDINSESQHIHR